MLIFATRTYWVNGYAFWAFIIASGLSIAFLVWFLKSSMSMEPYSIEVATVYRRDEEVMSYLVTYLIPFLGVSLSDARDVIAVCIVFAVVVVIYVKSNLIHINPLLNIIGFHLFEVVTDQGKPGTLIARRSYIRLHELVNVVSLDNYVWLEKPS